MSKKQTQIEDEYIIGIGITISDPVILVSSSIRAPSQGGATHGAFQDATPVLGDAEVVW